MAKTYARMTRTQTNEIGTWHAGVIYEVTHATAAKFEAYAKRGFCEPVTEKELEKLKAEAVKPAPEQKAEAETQAKAGKGAAE